MATLEPEPRQVQTARTIRLITSGRLTGIPHVVEARYVYRDGSFFVLSGKDNSDWVLNALTATTIRIRSEQFLYEASVRIASGEERRTALENFTGKYGSRVLHTWYPASCLCLVLGPSSQRPLQTTPQKATDYAEWQQVNPDYYEGIADAFSTASQEYDFTIFRNFINAWIRKRSVDEVLKIARPEDIVVEIGCGTGAEAIEIAKNVSGVIATDISKGMIDLVTKKVRARKLSHKIFPFHVKASEISRVAHLIPRGRVRLAYSFNGALNCEPRIQKFVEELSSILEPGGCFVCSVVNSLCFSEALAFAIALQFRRMAPRKQQPMMLYAGGRKVPCLGYSPASLAKIFSPDFKLKRFIALPAILPPPYLNDLYVKFRGIGSLFERLEPLLSSHPPFNQWGDQTLCVFQKTQGP